MPVLVIADFDDTGETEGQAGGVRVGGDDLGGLDL